MRTVAISSRVTNRESISFNQYLKDIYTISVMTPAEELECTKKAANGDKAAREELITRNLRFVVSVAKQYASADVPIEDLVNEGNIGLTMAADKFRPEMGFRFISYGVWWIQKLIHEYLAKHSRLVRLPANKINNISMLDKKISQMEQKLGRNVDVQEVIDEITLEFDAKDLEWLNTIKNFTIDSLDREVGEEDNTATVADLIIDHTSFEPTDRLARLSDNKTEIDRLLSGFKPRDKRIMVALFGLDGKAPMSLKEVSDEIGLTREMVRQIKVKCLDSLRSKLRNTTVEFI